MAPRSGVAPGSAGPDRRLPRSRATMQPPVATLRAGLALAVVAAVSAFAVRAQAQVLSQNAFQFRPYVGALLTTGNEHDQLKNAVLVGGQASYAFHPNFSAVGAFGWSPSQDKISPAQTKVDLYQYDVGIEGRLSDLTSGSPVVTRSQPRSA